VGRGAIESAIAATGNCNAVVVIHFRQRPTNLPGWSTATMSSKTWCHYLPFRIMSCARALGRFFRANTQACSDMFEELAPGC